MSQLNSIMRISALITVMIALFFSLLVMVNTIPSEKIYDNTVKSMNIIDSEGLKKKIGNVFIFRLDNFTDALMMNIAVGSDSDTPVKSSMKATYHIADDDLSTVTYAARCIASNDDCNLQSVDYERYWHGYLVFLKPLLTVMDYGNIRVLNYMCFTILILSVCVLLYKKCDRKMLYTFLLSILLINFWVVPLSMQFSTTFYISFMASIALLLCKNKALPYIFTVIGCLTGFFDFLTTPLVTLGLPLVICLSYVEKPSNNKYKSLFKYSLLWFIGYSSVWVSKWIIAYFIIGYNITDAVNSVIGRASSDTFNGVDMSLTGLLRILYSNTSLFLVFVFIVVVFILFNAVVYLKKAQKFKANAYLLLIASMPVVWFLVIRNHTIVHCWFVWRMFYVSLVAYILFLFKTLVKEKNSF